MLRDGWKHFMGGVKVCVRCTLLTAHNLSFLHSEASSWSPQSSAAAPLASDSAQHHEASLQCLKKIKSCLVLLLFISLSFLLTDSSCVSLVCTRPGPGAVPPGVADAVGHRGGKAGVISARQGLEVALHKPFSSTHLVHTLHAEQENIKVKKQL